MAMSTMESLNYAQGRLAVARAMCDHSEIKKWREHVEYWQSKIAAEEADSANEEVCKTCNGIKYIPATKFTPDKQCPECKGRGLTPRALAGRYCQYCGELLSEHLLTARGGACEPARQ